MSILKHSTINSIADSTFVVQSKDTSAFDSLKGAAVPSAFHSYVGRPQPGKCYPNTRVALLEGLEEWTIGKELPENLFDAGGAGAGKSAVAQTFAERCEDLGHIVASFFFFSTDPSRNHANRLVATLAYQIAQADPGARARIEGLIQTDPHLFDKDFKKQISSLIVDPLQRSTQTLVEEVHCHRPCTIIIDGLDECTGGDVQAGIIRAVCDALRTGDPRVQKNLPRFLICSRPEEPITKVFRSSNPLGMYTCIDLSSDTNADADIRTFLEGKFAEIRMSHPRADLIPASWPSRYRLSILQRNSSGHFIYAQTVVRLVSNDARPVATLEAVLGLRALPQRVREPWAELDELYRHILLRALEKSSMDTMWYVLGFVAVFGSASHTDIIAEFLELEDGELDTFLGTIPSLAFVRPFGRGIGLYHTTFKDFLQDEFRAGIFYIEQDSIRAYVWARCVDMASEGGNLDHVLTEMCELVSKCAFQSHYAYDFSAGEKSRSLFGLTQRRDFSTFLREFCNVDGPWAAYCFGYWLELLDTGARNNSHLIKEATRVMIDILTDLTLNSGHIVPLVMCRRSGWGSPDREVFFHWSKLNQDSFAKFLLECICFEDWVCTWDYCQTYFPTLERCLEDKQMGDHRVTAERYAEAYLFWMSHLTAEADWFPCKNKQVLQNQRSLIMNESARRQRAPFRWRRIKETIRPHLINGRQHFLWSPQWFRNDRGISVVRGYTHRELFFGSRSNLVFPNKRGSSSERLGPFRFIGRTATPWNGTKTAVRGYIKVQYLSGKLFFLQRAKLGARMVGKINRDDTGQATEHAYRDYDRRQEFRFVLARLPIMLAKASKSDAVAALRHKAFPLLAKCFPKLTQRARQALEEYAARHGYVSPYIDAGPRYTASITPQATSLSGNELEVSIAAPSGEVVVTHPPLFTSMSTCGQKRRRPHHFPPNHSNHPDDRICDEPGCETIINQRDRSINCSSPDCNREYHLRCQGMTDVPPAEWFCDEECERDVAVRKRMRYKL
ncbi:hypothetical protein D9619_013115 [Psilocybe cf. subviscida]|uniref:Nephrocystin 3-like N-terminal domain-containing protein n=1 Tax=Psilocybe cf. subviscida TaxID=2480587 RepID=A0A8H5EVU6_9AGAR|nr:hypothetical protein D9619_013115 [Psilocybe cf. subviscida]